MTTLVTVHNLCCEEKSGEMMTYSFYNITVLLFRCSLMICVYKLIKNGGHVCWPLNITIPRLPYRLFTI